MQPSDKVRDQGFEHDPELESLIQEALSLRLKMAEIAEAANLREAVLWRWRTQVRPAWDRREKALAGVKHLIDTTRKGYLEGHHGPDNDKP